MSAGGVRRKKPVRANKRGTASVAVAPTIADEPESAADGEGGDVAIITSELPTANAEARPQNGVHAETDGLLEDVPASDDDDAVTGLNEIVEGQSVATQPPAAELDHQRLKSVVESLIFVSERTVTAAQIARSMKIRAAVVRELVGELMLDYADRGVELIEVAVGYQFRSAASCAAFVREFVAQRPVRLTRAQLETLALISYRQPITRPEIDEVRGVDSGSAVRVLLERGLIKMLGRKDEPGRPLLYGTTTHFLEFFGMRSLKDLPTLREFTDLSDENRALFKRKTGESVEDAEAELLAAEEAARGDDQAEHISDEDLAELAREADAEDEDGEHVVAASDSPDARPERHDEDDEDDDDARATADSALDRNEDDDDRDDDDRDDDEDEDDDRDDDEDEDDGEDDDEDEDAR